MTSEPKPPAIRETQEIDSRTLKMLIGMMALTLPSLTSAFSNDVIKSISESYYQGGWAQSIFVGFLFAIAAFLLSYNGSSVREMILSKCAAVAALGVALFPCECGCHEELVPRVHGISAAVMFAILACFCRIFYQKAVKKGHSEAKRRAWIYVFCGWAIVTSIVLLGLDHFLGNKISAKVPRLTFYGECAGLLAFGVSWLISSKILPGVSRSDERLRLFSWFPG